MKQIDIDKLIDELFHLAEEEDKISNSPSVDDYSVKSSARILRLFAMAIDEASETTGDKNLKEASRNLIQYIEKNVDGFSEEFITKINAVKYWLDE